MKTTILIFIGLAFLPFKNQAQTVTDIDGNVYNTVNIGTQVWMKENLNVSHYSNGNQIPNDSNYLQWMYAVTGTYCNYNNDTTIGEIYGKLYNWYTVNDDRKVCPVGWHIPSINEWTILIDTLGGVNWAGMRLKEADTSHWNSPNPCANNESGFTALPEGFRDYQAWFTNIHLSGLWWTSDVYDSLNSWMVDMNLNCCGAYDNYYYKKTGASIRCIKNSPNVIKDENNIDNYIHIYPNPATDRIVIDYSYMQINLVSIYNIIGELLWQQELSKDKHDIDISSLSKGIYVIKITGANWTFQRKLIKE